MGVLGWIGGDVSSDIVYWKDGTSRFAEIIPPYHRRGNRVFSAAKRWPDFSVFLCLKGHLSIFSVIQTDPFCRVLFAVDFPGLRRFRE
jgi:hypothetical protein